MNLTDDIISQFVKATTVKEKRKAESTVYATVVVQDNSKYVRIDGSDILTPISTTTDVVDGDRVLVMIKNHEAVITGNITSPSASSTKVVDMSGDIDELWRAIDELGSTSNDSGWQNATLNNNFILYDSNSFVKYRKVGFVAEIRGVIKPKAPLPGSATQYNIFELPEEFRPANAIAVRCPADGYKSWLLTIENGFVNFSRYNSGNYTMKVNVETGNLESDVEYLDTDDETWLPFQVVYFIN